MQHPRRRFLRLMASAAALPALSRTAGAADYPTRPVTIMVPFAAGGPVDTLARIVGERMRVPLGQPVVIENAPGADGVIGVGRAARANPDGYTLCAGVWSTHVLNGALYPLQYDLLNDFEPVSLLSKNPYILETKKSVPAANLQELIAWVRANQDKISTAAASTAQRVIAFYFQKVTGTRFVVVPYRGSAPALQDLIAGNIDLFFDLPSNSLPHLRAGEIRVYAVTSATRIPSLPETPSMQEAGLPGFDITSWNAIWAPKGTPKSVISTLNAATADTLADPAVRARLADLGNEIPPPDQLTPEALGRLQKAEIEKWWPIIKESGIQQN